MKQPAYSGTVTCYFNGQGEQFCADCAKGFRMETFDDPLDAQMHGITDEDQLPFYNCSSCDQHVCADPEEVGNEHVA